MRKNTFVKIHANIIESAAHDQIKLIESSPAINGYVAIMPDVHVGAGCVIGFTAKIGDKIIPNLIGVDIGCGVIAFNLGKVDIDYEKLDVDIRNKIPIGYNSHTQNSRNKSPISKLWTFDKTIERIGYKKDVSLQIGTLGGGNHFIEVAVDETGDKWLLIHSGSRNFGKSIAEYHQKKAVKLCNDMGISVPKDLEYLPLDFGGNDYLHDMKVAQHFAEMNREEMLKQILNFFGIMFHKKDYI